MDDDCKCIKLRGWQFWRWNKIPERISYLIEKEKSEEAKKVNDDKKKDVNI